MTSGKVLSFWSHQSGSQKNVTLDKNHTQTQLKKKLCLCFLPSSLHDLWLFLSSFFKMISLVWPGSIFCSIIVILYTNILIDQSLDHFSHYLRTRKSCQQFHFPTAGKSSSKISSFSTNFWESHSSWDWTWWVGWHADGYQALGVVIIVYLRFHGHLSSITRSFIRLWTLFLGCKSLQGERPISFSAPCTRFASWRFGPTITYITYTRSHHRELQRVPLTPFLPSQGCSPCPSLILFASAWKKKTPGTISPQTCWDFPWGTP